MGGEYFGLKVINICVTKKLHSGIKNSSRSGCFFKEFAIGIRLPLKIVIKTIRSFPHPDLQFQKLRLSDSLILFS
jgi:hypothetical protein